jgi:hypothetical protein
MSFYRFEYTAFHKSVKCHVEQPFIVDVKKYNNPFDLVSAQAELHRQTFSVEWLNKLSKTNIDDLTVHMREQMSYTWRNIASFQGQQFTMLNEQNKIKYTNYKIFSEKHMGMPMPTDTSQMWERNSSHTMNERIGNLMQLYSNYLKQNSLLEQLRFASNQQLVRLYTIEQLDVYKHNWISHNDPLIRITYC